MKKWMKEREGNRTINPESERERERERERTSNFSVEEEMVIADLHALPSLMGR